MRTVRRAGRDRKKEHHTRAIGAFARRALKHLAKGVPGWRKLRKVVIAMEHHRTGLHPVIHEGLLHLRDDGPLDAVV